MSRSRRSSRSSKPGFARFLIAAVFLLSTCGQDYNSNSGDAVYGTPPEDTAQSCSTEAEQRTCAAIVVLNRYCFSCHPTWRDYKSDADYEHSGLITFGNGKGSLLIRRLVNEGGNMPPSKQPLPDADYEALLEWAGAL